ncbi:copper ion binding protein, putative [Ricinus communis]|uniref:Copper ion binding protein, putative n=2 Tax=Ricinus communis TaxID=3988 RepID=B9SB85_RICCO|nr:copper ion binding protein, putative [Ricinus communis]
MTVPLATLPSPFIPNSRRTPHFRSSSGSMEQRRLSHLSLSFSCLHIHMHLLVVVLALISISGSADAYKNYTVGDSLGWYDSTEKPNLNYQKWADSKNFSLGDFLIFNTNNNHSVVQTYNLTTYELCDYDNALENDTIEWSTTDPSNTATFGVTVDVPLLKEGITYFFSGDYDGDQCKSGMHFNINVTHGKGLPESLKSPSEQAPAPNSPDVTGDDSAPDTIVPANFDHPQDVSDDDDAEDSGSISVYLNLLDRKLNGVLLLFGVVCMFR